MDRLNYFTGTTENDLTRAYLVLLKYSSNAFYAFFEYLRCNHSLKDSEKAISFIDLLEDSWEIYTQKGNPQINTDFLLSILITDTTIANDENVIQSSERNAIYDGIIKFGSKLTIVIENKPRSQNVWFGQLNPSRQNLADETIVYSSPSILEWKTIIKHLSNLLSIPIIAGYEKLMIEDFLSYVDEAFPFLNPYDKFHLCKGNHELINRRIVSLLKSIALDESKVSYQRSWGYNISISNEQIQKIGLIFCNNDKDWWLELSLYFGNSQRQAISFFKSNPQINNLDTEVWDLQADFHLSFMTSNLIWFKSEDAVLYLDFWKKNINKIHQQKRDDIPKYIQWLVDENVINLSSEVSEKMKTKFYDTAMQTLNVCPGFGLVYTINSVDAEEWDKIGKLENLISEKIKEGLSVVGINGNNLLKVSTN